MGQGPYGPGPIWARGPMGQGPYGPGAIWAPGPWALGPSLLGENLTKNAPWKKESKLCFFAVFWKQKKCATSVPSFLAAVSRRELCYVSENKGFRFAKNKLIHADSSFIAAGAEHTFAS